MLSREDNERLTRVGPGTPMGTLMRRYWIPVAYSHQVAEADGPPLRVKLLCENLVAFRDTDGRVGLVDERCPHRTASLFFARNEERGLRCVYHGIKFDINGNCMDVPCLPPGTAASQVEAVKRQIRLKAYPCIERGGLVWTYMGPAELKPDFPDLEWIGLPAEQRFDTRHVQECNWLQGVEGGYDAPHLTFLHRADGGTRNRRLIVPSLYEVVATDFGFVVGTGRDYGGDDIEWNINVFLMPFHKIISSVPHGAHMWVPIDDENTMLYSISFNPHRPFTAADLAEEAGWQGIHTENTPGTDHAIANRGNDYLIDRALQASGKSYTGLKGFGTQDCAIQESMGPIADRSLENLLVNDLAIAKIRRLLLDTLKDMAAGLNPPGLDPASCRVRSTRYQAPRQARFLDDVKERVRADA
ncbi:MAG TPA: Rieske 2Fe-2S domain-containing protein [Stellaceae bacterium]|nr:Rieske 2Fe-2S domain-containing protein [Stellaceae bacterium]